MKGKVVLKCDASDLGIGAVLEQEQKNGERRPVCYWSSQFRSYEKNYSVSEKEALACVAAMQKFKKYLLGRHFVLLTDHKALTTVLGQSTPKKTISRIERWREKLAAFDYSVEYIKGSENEIADWLSRSAEDIDHKEVSLCEEIVINSISEADVNDPLFYGAEMRKLSEIINHEDWTEGHKKKFTEFARCAEKLSVHSGRIFYEQTRFLSDKSRRREILEVGHERHQGVSRTSARIREFFWWLSGQRNREFR